MKKKIVLNDLKVKSFVTEISNNKEVKAGGDGVRIWRSCYWFFCPQP